MPVGRGPGPAAGARHRTGWQGAVRRSPAAAASVRVPGRRAGRHARGPARGPGRGPQGGPRRADPAAAHGRRRAAGLAGTRPPGVARHTWCTETFGSFGVGQARPGVAGWLAGTRARPRPGGCARGPRWFGAGRFRVAGRGRDLRRIAGLPGRGGPLRGRPGRPRPGAAGARDRERRVRRPVAAGARRRGRAARPRSGRGHAPVLPGGHRAGPRSAARQRPGCPGRRRRPGPAARPAAARAARPHPGAPAGGRTVRARADRDRCPPRRGDAAGRGGDRRAGRGTRRVAGRRRDPGGPGAYLLPAGRAGHPGPRSLAGRVRAAVRRGPQPHGLRRRRLVRPRGRDGLRRRPGGGTAGRPGRGRPAVRRARGRAARAGPGPGGDGNLWRVPVPQGDRAAAGRGRVRRAAARLGAQGQARAEADHAVAEHGGLVGRGGGGPVRPGRPGGLPVRGGGGR